MTTAQIRRLLVDRLAMHRWQARTTPAFREMHRHQAQECEILIRNVDEIVKKEAACPCV